MKLLILVTLLAVAFAKKVGRVDNTYNNSKGQIIHSSLSYNQPTLCDPNVKQYSGYFSAGSNKEYFYWFFESRTSPSTDPLIMWLTGGPGCSSIMACLVENGPCSVNEAGDDTILRNTSWNTNANIMWVDQPPGTGFSTGSKDTNEEEVATDMYSFLQNFILAFPDYFKNGFYVFGESYAGHYVPAITHKIYEENLAKTGTNIPLKAFAIGNGLTDPYIQFAYYAQMAYDSGTAPSVISKTTYNFMTNAIPTCQSDILHCNDVDTTTNCDDAYTYCTTHELDPVTSTGINPYDLRVECGSSSLCYNFTNVDTWLNNETVQAALGVSKKWEECNNLVNKMFESDWMVDYQTKLPPMLENGIRGLIYAGDQDFICNWLGNQAWSLALNWTHTADFNKAAVNDWTPDGTWRGKIRTSNGFTFLQVFEAGHMVPMNQPQSAWLMVKEYLSGAI